MRGTWLLLLVAAVLGAGCASSETTKTDDPHGLPAVWSIGCGGSPIYAPPAPSWATQQLEELPWLAPAPASAKMVGIIFGPWAYLVPAGQVHPGGASNKISWVSGTDGDLIVTARLTSTSQPAVTFDLGRVTIPRGSLGPNKAAWHWGAELPAPGCWDLQLDWGGRSAHVHVLVKPGVPTPPAA